MKKIIFAVLFATITAGCTNEPKATEILQKNGYTNIEMTGYNPFACSEDDFYHTGFKAKSISGQIIEGTVCGGILFKGSTIRF